jgi:hypothetical protein
MKNSHKTSSVQWKMDEEEAEPYPGMAMIITTLEKEHKFPKIS